MKLRSTARRFAALPIVAIGLTSVLAACGGPPPVPGNPADYKLNVTAGQVMRWNPCKVVHYRVNIAIEPTNGLATVQGALATLSQASGITFAYDGTTNYIPQSAQGAQPAPLVISFARHSGQALGSSVLNQPNQVGEGGWTGHATSVNGSPYVYQITTGYVVVDADALRFRGAQMQTSTMLHELGHAVGLNHAAQAAEVMYPTISNTTGTSYAAGDLTGLTKVGATQGCLPALP